MAAFRAKVDGHVHAGGALLTIGAGVGAGLAFAVAMVSIVPPGGEAISQAAASDREASLAAWDRVVSVLQHPRCLNCHQPNQPLQGDSQRLHSPRVVRGRDNRGAPGMRCGNCHSEQRNNEASKVPGAAHWKFAPRSMGWAGLSIGGVCRSVKDRARNGGRSPKALVKHVAEDTLVHWAWDPGGKRESVSMPHSVFVEFVEEWVQSGAHCPD